MLKKKVEIEELDFLIDIEKWRRNRFNLDLDLGIYLVYQVFFLMIYIYCDCFNIMIYKVYVEIIMVVLIYM